MIVIHSDDLGKYTCNLASFYVSYKLTEYTHVIVCKSRPMLTVQRERYGGVIA